MTRAIHVFENGVRVFEDHLVDKQRRRYKLRNVHETGEEDVFVRAILSIPPDGVFVNIGAAIGYYPILAKKLSPDLNVHAVEPLDRHRESMRENFALNDLGESQITMHAEATSSSNGVVKLIDSGYASSIYPRLTTKMPIRNLMRALLSKMPFGREPAGAIRSVPTVTLDHLVERIGSIIDLVQMDVQGFELDVLEGGTRSLAKAKVRSLLIGTHRSWIHKRCAQFLADYGYYIEIDEQEVAGQPDGIILASRGGPILGAERPRS